MKFLSGNILLCGMMLPLLLSCMSYDGELVTDSDGMTALSVRGYVYAGADAANASSAGGAVVSVTVFDRDDTECLCPLAEADAAASDDGYYEVRLLLRPDGDSVICVQAEMPDGGGSANGTKSIYTWKSALYDRTIEAYCANIAPIYIQ